MHVAPNTRQIRKRPRLRVRSGRALRALHGQDGQALVELALVLPVLLLIVFGIADFGRAMNYDGQATHFANEAARYAAVGQVPSRASGTLGQWVRAQADSSALRSGTGAAQVCVSYPNGTSNVGDPVAVSMSFKYSWLPILHLGVTSTTITRSATMRIENPPTGSFYASGCT